MGRVATGSAAAAADQRLTGTFLEPKFGPMSATARGAGPSLLYLAVASLTSLMCAPTRSFEASSEPDSAAGAHPDTTARGGEGNLAGSDSSSGGDRGTSVGGSAGAAGGAEHGAASSGAASGEVPRNECGGDEVLSGAVGDSCAPCSTLQCDEAGALTCELTCLIAAPLCDVQHEECVRCLGPDDCEGATPECVEGECLTCKPLSTSCAKTTPRTCNSDGSGWAAQPIVEGECGALCSPGALRCIGTVGQRCAADGGSFASSGSNLPCGCTDSRFRMLVEGMRKSIHDSSTGLTWDFPEHAPATFAEASDTCAAQGMRLPSFAELSGLLLNGAVASACAARLVLTIDTVAFPGIKPQTVFWTNRPIPSFPGTVEVALFPAPSSQSGSVVVSSDRSTTQLVSYQCVKE
jgi:hypothetical protein